LNILYLISEDILELPILYLSRYITQNKKEYYNLLQKVRDENIWEAWILFMLDALASTAKQTIGTIESIKIHTSKNTALVYFEDVNDIDSASLLTNNNLYLPLASLPVLEGNKFYFHEVHDFLLIDTDFGEIGKIKQILEYPNQALFQTFYGDKEVLIPINDRSIQKVDREKKEIHLNLPEGLLDIYIEKQ